MRRPLPSVRTKAYRTFETVRMDSVWGTLRTRQVPLLVSMGRALSNLAPAAIVSHCAELIDFDEADYMDGRWRVTVNWAGSRAGLEHFLERVESRLSLTGDVLEVDQAELKGCQAAGDAHDLAEKIVEAASKVASLAAPGLKFSVGTVFERNSGKPPSQYVFAKGIAALQIGSSFHIDVYDAAGNKILPVRWPRHVLDQPVVKHALEILASLEDGDWGGLFKLIELLQSDRAPLAKWELKARLDRISRQANSPTAVGLNARHAIERSAPPSSSLSFGEAVSDVRDAVTRWIESKSV